MAGYIKASMKMIRNTGLALLSGQTEGNMWDNGKMDASMELVSTFYPQK
jgi:hypothetical protein